MKRPIAAAALAAVLSACAVSSHHLGFHALDDGRRPYELVGNRYVKDLSAVEAPWVEKIATGNFDGLVPSLAPRLAQALTPALRKTLGDRVRRFYGLNGEYEIQTFGVPPVSLARSVKREPFSYYDMVGTAFFLDGKTPATLHLYVTKIGVDGDLKICGIELYTKREGDREPGKDLRLVLPETVDRSDFIATLPVPRLER